MRIVRILLLDSTPELIPDLSSHGIRFEIDQEAHWATLEVYRVRPNLCEKIKRVTTSKEVDLIIVGNNLGAGVMKAEAIADEMKLMTIVVWNSFNPGDETPYAKLGFKNFGRRGDLRRLIPNILGIT